MYNELTKKIIMIYGVKFYSMDLVNDVLRTMKPDPHNRSALCRSKLPSYFFAVCGPKFTKLSAHAQERLQLQNLQCRFPFDDIVFAIKFGSCPKFAPNCDVFGQPIFLCWRAPNF